MVIKGVEIKKEPSQTFSTKMNHSFGSSNLRYNNSHDLDVVMDVESEKKILNQVSN